MNSFKTDQLDINDLYNGRLNTLESKNDVNELDITNIKSDVIDIQTLTNNHTGLINTINDALIDINTELDNMGTNQSIQEIRDDLLTKTAEISGIL